MVEPRNVENLLETGYFKTSRSKSPKPPTNPIIPALSRESFRPDPQVPRSFPAPPTKPSSRRRYPPPPTVEDEEVALAKEHGSSVVSGSSEEEPKSRGDVEQNPILMEVHEHNPERRFVIVANSDSQTDDDDDDLSDNARQSAGPRKPRVRKNGDYKANTGRKYAPDPAAEITGARKPSYERRRSRQDLPRIETDLNPDDPNNRHHTRARSATYVDQGDYFSPQHIKRPSGDGLLSPQVIKHATGGREKLYYDYSGAQTGPSPPQRSRSSLTDDRRYDDNYARPSLSTSPVLSKRSNSAFENPKQSKRVSEEKPSDSTRNREQYASSPRLDRNNTEPPYGRPERERDGLSRQNSGYRKRDSLARRDDSGSSGEYSQTPRPPNSRRRKSIVQQEDKDALLSPDTGRNTGRSRSRAAQSPMPSPKIPSRGFADEMAASPRTPTIFPSSRDGREKSAPYPDDDFAPRSSRLSVRQTDRSAARSRSRAPSINIAPALAMPIAIPIAIATGLSSPADRRRSPMPSPPETRSSLSQSSPRQESFWQPAPFDPVKDGLRVDQPVGSYRRYSEDADRGGLPNLPECSRKDGVVGKVDWLSLPRCDNFNICPDCYTAVFANSPFRNDFMPIMFRPRDKAIACDFGSSPWYRIAWLLTLKTQQPDLRLFHQIVAVNGKVALNNQPCPGDRKANRVWYSIKNPRTQATLPDFTVCYECAKTIEILLPSLTGVFVTLESASRPTRSTCAMHFNSDRKRFVLYFDAMETTSDKALASTQPPNITSLVSEIERLSMFAECREDRPVSDENWHVMQILPELTVCGECFDDVVRPRLKDSSIIARNFYMEPQRLPVATCQLYSSRMREIFKKACRRNDPQYLEAKILERRKIEADIHAKLAKLDQAGANDQWTEDEVEKLIQEWKRWE